LIGKGPGWLHSLRLIELFPDLTNLNKKLFHRELRNNNFRSVLIFTVAM
jgi:hypothetical protein